jgi:predicted ferric reductase
VRSKYWAAGTLWISLYAALSLAPLVFVLISSRVSQMPRPFWTELSVGLGFVGLAMMGLQFALTARFGWLKAPFGSDIIYAFHRTISMVAVALVLAHPVLLFATRWETMLQRPFTHPWPFWTGTFSVLCLLWIIAVSVWRTRLRIGYDQWRRAHAALAVLAVAAAIVHVLFIGHYLAAPWQRAFWLIYTLAFVGLILYVRVIKPMIELRRPWEIVAATPQRGDATTLTLRPVGHPGFTFSPGQFAWLTVGDSPFSDREHPFSFSGSAQAALPTAQPHPTIEFTIKSLGDWTSRIQHATPGTRVYVDGPFGALSADRTPDAEAIALFAGGIGITPMLSHIRTFRDRADPRPIWLFYAARDWDTLTLRDEIEHLRAKLPTLRVVYVLSSTATVPAAQPPIPAVQGLITPDLIRAHAPDLTELITQRRRVECFICGPNPMMEAVEKHLATLGVPLGDYHCERFNLV